VVQLVVMDLQYVTLEYHSYLSSLLLLKNIPLLNNKCMFMFQKMLKSLKGSGRRCNVYYVVLRGNFSLKNSEIYFAKVP